MNKELSSQIKEEDLQKENKYLKIMIENLKKENESNLNLLNKKIDSLKETNEINSKLFQLKIENKEKDLSLEKEEYQKLFELKEKIEERMKKVEVDSLEKLKEEQWNVNRKDVTIHRLKNDIEDLKNRNDELTHDLEHTQRMLKMNQEYYDNSMMELTHKEEDLFTQIKELKIKENKTNDLIIELQKSNQDKDEEIIKMKQLIQELNILVQSLQILQKENENEKNNLKAEIEGMKLYKNEIKEVYEKMIREYKMDFENNLEMLKISMSQEKK